MYTEEDPQLKRRTEDNTSTDNKSVLRPALPQWDKDSRNGVGERALSQIIIKTAISRRMPTMHSTSGNQLHTEDDTGHNMIRSQAHNGNEEDNDDKYHA